MNQKEDKFDNLKWEIRTLLGEFLSLSDFTEPTCDVENRNAMNIAIEKTRHLRDKINNIEANETGVFIIKACLNLIQSQSGSLGLNEMASRATELAERLDTLKEDDLRSVA
jgi:hypothetical protein